MGPEKNYDYYVWLNDDSILFKNAFSIIYRDLKEKSSSIIVGTFISSNENFSELTYVIEPDGRVVQNNMDDIYKSRKGKRYLKYQQYRRKRYEKKRAYLQEEANKSK